jgi:endonuclease YncB( thermonuclease family)
MSRIPKEGLTLRCKLAQCQRDGDTIVVEGKFTKLEWAIRVKDCWCAERHTDAGKAAIAYRDKLLCGETHVYVVVDGIEHAVNVLRNLSFDRIPARIVLMDGRDYATEMIRAGHATKRKLKALTVKPRRTP